MIRAFARTGETIGAVLSIGYEALMDRPLVGGGATREQLALEEMRRRHGASPMFSVDVEIVSTPDERAVRRWMLEHRDEYPEDPTGLAEAAAQHFDHDTGEDDWLSDPGHFVWDLAADLSDTEEDRAERRADRAREDLQADRGY